MAAEVLQDCFPGTFVGTHRCGAQKASERGQEGQASVRLPTHLVVTSLQLNATQKISQRPAQKSHGQSRDTLIPHVTTVARLREFMLATYPVG